MITTQYLECSNYIFRFTAIALALHHHLLYYVNLDAENVIILCTYYYNKMVVLATGSKQSITFLACAFSPLVFAINLNCSRTFCFGYHKLNNSTASNIGSGPVWPVAAAAWRQMIALSVGLCWPAPPCRDRPPITIRYLSTVHD